MSILENRAKYLLVRLRTVLNIRDHSLSPEGGGVKPHHRTANAVLEQLEHTLTDSRSSLYQRVVTIGPVAVHLQIEQKD